MKEASIAKCPKCRKNNLILIEDWRGHYIVWEQENGVVDLEKGDIHSQGYPHQVRGECKDCGHKWKFRKSTQISGVI